MIRHIPSIQQSNLDKNKSKGRFSKIQKFIRQPRAAFKQEADYTVRKSLAEMVRDELLVEKQELFHQRVFMFGKNCDLAKQLPASTAALDSTVKTDQVFDTKSVQEYFFDSFRDLLATAIGKVEDDTFTEDKLNGLFLCMGDYTLLVVEGAEDMVDEFFYILDQHSEEFWTATLVFLVEDRIKSTYFDAFVCRQSTAVNVNEKFPTSTPNDEYEMGMQHWKIKEKLQELCATLSSRLRNTDGDEPDDSDEYLPADIFNKLLPEVQRLELVFTSQRFYRNLKDFSLSYRFIAIHESEFDAMTWPLKYNYTPAGIFKSTEFEVNLTFGDYGKEEAKESPKTSLVPVEEETAPKKSIVE